VDAGNKNVMTTATTTNVPITVGRKTISHITPSRLEAARLCEARAIAQAVDEEYEEESGEGARIGTLAHAAAQFWFHPLYRAQVPDVERAFALGIDQCSKYGEMPLQPDGVSEAKTLFKCITEFYNRDAIRVVFAERAYKGGLANGVPVSLRIDMGVDRGNGVLEVIDYKTGFLTTSDGEMRAKDQVLLNLLAVCRDPELSQFPTKKFTYFWVRHGEASASVELSSEELDAYELALAYEYQRLLNLTNPVERINPFCMSCGRRSECVKFRQLLQEAFIVEGIDEAQMAAIGDGDLMKITARFQSQVKILDAIVSTLKGLLLGRLDALSQRGQEAKIAADGLQASRVQPRQSYYDTEVVLSLCRMHNIAAGDVVSVNKKKVDEALTDKPGALQQLQRSMRHGRSSPYVRLSAVPASRRRAPSPTEQQA